MVCCLPKHIVSLSYIIFILFELWYYLLYILVNFNVLTYWSLTYCNYCYKTWWRCHLWYIQAVFFPNKFYLKCLKCLCLLLYCDIFVSDVFCDILLFYQYWVLTALYSLAGRVVRAGNLYAIHVKAWKTSCTLQESRNIKLVVWKRLIIVSYGSEWVGENYSGDDYYHVTGL